ncbi:hypothetical protein DPMN_166514 [Dreissena polymorpha]|uniref:Uncharacterized protein n=1 Tax=Dreissena polymorpha TaxID=45954 RepID=A0A9D4IU81_DREPO|nr:hypothetical protein DPMN_166514 [Dreissena polymorpha]
MWPRRQLAEQNQAETVVPFKIEWALGKWFTQSRQEPCSWKGSADFQNMELNIVLDPKNGIIYDHSMWRVGNRCVYVTFDVHQTKQPGVLLIKDPLGKFTVITL